MRGAVVAGEAGLLGGDTVLGSWRARVVFFGDGSAGDVGCL